MYMQMWGFVDFFSALMQTFKTLFLNVLLDRYLFYHFWQPSFPHGFLLFVQFSVCTSARLCVWAQWFMLSNIVYFLLMEQNSTGKMQVQQKCASSYYVLLINNMATYFCCLSVKWRWRELHWALGWDLKWILNRKKIFLGFWSFNKNCG